MTGLDILVAGSGAIGGYFGAVLARAGHRVTMIARGAHLVALRENGLQVIDGPDEGTVPVNAVDDLAEAAPPDLVLFAVKTYDTAVAARTLRPWLRGDSLVLELQNGVDRAEVIAEIVGGDRVLAGTVFMESALELPGVVRYLSGPRRIIFGEPRGGSSPRVSRVHRVLEDAGINAEAPDDVRPSLWRKFALVCTANGLTAITRNPFGKLLQADGGRHVIADLLTEVVAIAHARNVVLPNETVSESIAFLEELGPALRSSMLRDIERGRPVEVDALNGYVVLLSDRLEVPVPANRVVALALNLHNQQVETQLARDNKELL